MLKTWSAIVAALLAGSVCWAAPDTPGHLPPIPPPVALDSPVHSAQTAPLMSVVEDGHQPVGCCNGCNGGKHECFLHCLVRFFSYRPCHLTSIHEILDQPHVPQPPVYLYLSYPPIVEGPGSTYPCCDHKNCWGGSCSAGQHMFALPSGQNAGFDH
jgi:hypothetical protein